MRFRSAAALCCCLVVSIANWASADDTEQKMTARIDALTAQAWKAAGVEPVRPARDAEFLRRAYLDLTGVTPSVGEVRAFLAAKSPDRAALIRKLVEKPNHAQHLANIWRDVMLPRNSNAVRFGQDRSFTNWLQGHFADNTPYDEMVRELLTTTGRVNQSGPVLYYTALELKPEELAASTSRIFLGVQIQCAQCHDHPFDHWKQKDFWGYAAFFSQLRRSTNRQQTVQFEVVDIETGDVKLPETDTVVPPSFLGAPMGDDVTGTRRQVLSAWLTSKDNPYFARATVNRVWALMFGYGLVNPVDDFGEHNEPSHPELLNELAADFSGHGFDMQRLFRVLANTRAYQLSSEWSSTAEVDPRLLSRMPVKSLTAEQIYDCLKMATGIRQTATAGRTNITFNGRLDPRKAAFLAKFEAPAQGLTEFQSGIPQALTMMNGAMIADSTDVTKSDLLIAVIDSPFMSNPQRVETLFLATLSRMPRDDEQAKFVRYVESGGRNKDSNKALADVFWALLNSSEFILNH